MYPRSVTPMAKMVPPQEIFPLIKQARKGGFYLIECHGISSKVVVSDSYCFHYVSKPLDFTGRLGDRYINFRDLDSPALLPMNIGTPFHADRTGPIPTPIYVASMQYGFLSSLAEELFDIGRVDFEETRFRCLPGFETSLSRYIAEVLADTTDSLAVADSLSTIIVVDYLRAVEPNRLSRSVLGSKKAHPGVALARKSMIHDYPENLTLDELARIAHLSVAQFIAVFKKEYRETPHDFLRRVRISKAMRLIEHGYDLIDVGLSVGYASSSGFRSAFRRMTGMSPEEYRSSIKE
jgi:AraC-like DNA-binding protein